MRYSLINFKTREKYQINLNHKIEVLFSSSMTTRKNIPPYKTNFITYMRRNLSITKKMYKIPIKESTKSA